MNMTNVTNRQLLSELLKALENMDFFNLYPSKSDLRRYLAEGVSDTDKIRVILREELVQRELFPNWQRNKDKLDDPVAAYKDLRSNPRWPDTGEE
jgi:hypothetical protein